MVFNGRTGRNAFFANFACDLRFFADSPALFFVAIFKLLFLARETPARTAGKISCTVRRCQIDLLCIASNSAPSRADAAAERPLGAWGLINALLGQVKY